MLWIKAVLGQVQRLSSNLPKPTTQVIPMLVTGHSRQSLDWIARESAGWINYPRAPKMQRLIVEDWRMEVMKQCGSVYKP